MNKKLTFLRPLALFLMLAQAASGTDLALQIAVSQREAKRGDIISANIRLLNQGHSAASGISVKIALLRGFRLINPSVSIGDYDQAAGLWRIKEMPATLACAELHLFLETETDGPLPIRAEILLQGENDADSRPGNAKVGEDDLVFAYVTVPLVFCDGMDINLVAEAMQGFAEYQWFRDGQPVAGATQSRYTIKAAGQYNCHARDGAGEVSETTPVIVRRSSTMKVELTDNQQVCAGETLLVRPQVTGGTPPYTFQWNNDRHLDLSQRLKSNTEFLLGVSVVDALGCAQKSSAHIRVVECGQK